MKISKRELLIGASALAADKALAQTITPQLGGGLGYGFDGGISGKGQSQPAFAKSGGPGPWAAMGSQHIYDSANGITWAVWQGTDGRNAVIQVAVFNHNATPYVTGTAVNIPPQSWGEVYQVGVCVATTFRQTNHGFPSACLDSGGYFHVFFGTWFNDALQHAICTTPGNPEAWTQLANVGNTTTDCPLYVNALMVSSTMYLIYQHSVVATTGQIRAVSSASITSGVVTWNAPVTLLDLGTSEAFPGNAKVIGTDIWFPITRSLTGAINPRDNIYLLRYDTTNGNVKNVDASTVTLPASFPLTDAQLIASYLVFAPGAGNGGVIATFDIGGDGIPRVLYAFGANPVQYFNTYDIRVRKFSSGAWSDDATGLGTTAAGFNSLCIMTEADGSMSAYWPNTNATLQALSIPNGGDIAVAKQPQGGAWGAKTILQVAGQTSGAFYNSNGPFPLDAPKPVLNGLPGLKVVWGEQIPQTGLAGLTGGFLRLYAYGTSYHGAARQDFVSNATSGLIAKYIQKPTVARGVLLDALCGALQASGAFAAYYALWVAAAHSAQAQGISIIGPKSVSATSMIFYDNPTLSNISSVINQGWQGNGTNGYIDTLHGEQTTQNSVSVMGYLLNATSTLSGSIVVAGTTGGNRIQLVASSATAMAGRLNSNAAPVIPTISTQVGMFAYERGASNLSTMYQNGAAIGTETNASTGLPAGNIFLLGDHTNNTGFSNQLLAAAGLAPFRGATAQLADYNALHPYMQAVAGAP